MTFKKNFIKCIFAKVLVYSKLNILLYCSLFKRYLDKYFIKIQDDFATTAQQFI